MDGIAEGDRVQITVEGTVLWLGGKSFEVDDWIFDLADLQRPGFTVKKL